MIVHFVCVDYKPGVADPFTRRHGVPSTRVLIPWGCGVYYRRPKDEVEKYENPSALGVILCYARLGGYEVMDFKHYVDTKGGVRTHTTRDVAMLHAEIANAVARP